jgi:short subunit dehydrogenase-like uncharacterized protein
LENLRTELVAVDQAAANVDILVGDSNSLSDMEALAAQTDVIATTAGPFALHGSLLFEACAKQGTSYCDLTGEAKWVDLMASKHHAKAQETGARLVPGAGFDSVPSDLGTYLIVRRFQEQFGTSPTRVNMYVTGLKGGLQGGTLNTVLNEIENPTPKAPRDAANVAKGRTKLEWRKGIWYDSSIGRWTIPFFMASANQPIVRRSNAQLGYCDDMGYSESSALGFLSAVSQYVGYAIGLLCLLIPPTRSLLKRFVLPQSGQGPSRDAMIGGRYKYTFVASGGDHELKMDWAGRGDPGGIGTTIILGECAACLALEKDRLPSKGGVLTPVSAMADALWERLQKASWARDDSPAIAVNFK